MTTKLLLELNKICVFGSYLYLIWGGAVFGGVLSYADPQKNPKKFSRKCYQFYHVSCCISKVANI